MTTPTEEFLVNRNGDIDKRVGEIDAAIAKLDEDRATLVGEKRALLKERNRNMISLGIPVRPRKAAPEAATE